MFNESQYDIIDMKAPVAGMNQNFSQEALSQGYAWALENLFPLPHGELTVRFGTRDTLIKTDVGTTIVRMFPFTDQDGTDQVVLLKSVFIKDETVQDPSATGSSVLSFETTQPGRFIRSTPVRIVFEKDGVFTLDDVVDNMISAKDPHWPNQHLLYLKNNELPAGAVIRGVFFAVGQFEVWRFPEPGTFMPHKIATFDTAPYWRKLNSVCRAVRFGRSLYICNGVDRVVEWDGTTLKFTGQYLPDAAKTFTRVNDHSLTCVIDPATFRIANYAAGSAVEVVVNGVPWTGTILNAALAGDGITLTLNTTLASPVLPVFAGATKITLFFWRDVPKFSFMYPVYDRIFALGEGASAIGLRSSAESMKVYFMYQPGAQARWFDERTGFVPSFSLAENHGDHDQLEAIAYTNGHLVFIGRKKTQAWTGTEPVGGVMAPGKPPLQFSTMVPVGCPHGDLVLELANDVTVVTESGLVSFSTLNVAQQFSMNPTEAVNPVLKEFVQGALSDETEYRATGMFRYDRGGFVGFRFGQSSMVLSALYTSTLYGWTYLSGDFQYANALCSSGRGLLLSRGNSVLHYADGSWDGLKGYGDNNGKSPVLFMWVSPYMAFKTAYAGLYYDMDITSSSSCAIDPESGLEVSVTATLPRSHTQFSPYSFRMQGDPLSSIPLCNLDEKHVNGHSFGLRLEQDNQVFRKRFKFCSHKFFVRITGASRFGPIHLNSLRIFGTQRR